MSASRVPNYELSEKLDRVLSIQQDSLIAIARIEENIKAHTETLDRHEKCIKENADTEKQWRGVNAAITAIAAAVAAVIGVSK